MSGIVFDLDGTLVESASAICAVANRLMREFALPELDVAETRDYVGNGAGKFLERALHARDAFSAADFEEALARFMDLYAKAPPEDNSPMPGCEEALRALAARGHRIAICTNKPLVPTLAVVEAMGWDGLFSSIVAGDSLDERKPHPAPLLKAIADLEAPLGLFVGDSEVDAATAKAADVPFLLYTEGYRKTPAADLPYAAAFDAYERLPLLVSEVIERVSSPARRR